MQKLTPRELLLLIAAARYVARDVPAFRAELKAAAVKLAAVREAAQ
jgi:hypothetical protein